MASDDMPDAAFTHTVRGFFGEELTIGAYPPEDPDDGGAVQFLVRDEHGKTATAHISSPAERESLARAWMEACRIADGEKPAAEPERVPEAGTIPPGLTCSACRKPLDGHKRGSDGVTYICPAIGSAARPITGDELRDELAAAASALDATRDGRHAWNDPDAY